MHPSFSNSEYKNIGTSKSLGQILIVLFGIKYKMGYAKPNYVIGYINKVITRVMDKLS